jgi:regulator of protease activity HflC (stomatin/prohibitin superfamily)
MDNDLKIVLAGVGAVILAVLAALSVETVAPGHRAVPILFGNVKEDSLGPGFHIVNPLYSFAHFDCRHKTHLEKKMVVPSRDKLNTEMDISVQYSFDPTLVCNTYQETGNVDKTVNVHMIPKLRAVVRDQGKVIDKAEMFFTEETLTTMRANVHDLLNDYCSPKGIIIEEVLIRDVQLPMVIQKAVTQTKERQEQTAREQAEFERFEIEERKKVITATASKEAAEQLAQEKRLIAEANAYEIEKLGEMLREYPEVLQRDFIQGWDGVLPRVLGGTSDLQFLLPVDQ